ncbi:hypothetical protein [Collinsella aerofaciens]|uniref:hypothetical protein n=1 Tax=Collinsella aerofaciens TaxID=74426 RepID=UPI003D7A9F60
MKIYLPNDADGNVIPSNVKVMYEKDGTVVRVDDMIYLIDSKKWRVRSGNMTFIPSQLYLNKPDSLKQLAADLDRVANDPEMLACTYLNRDKRNCCGCKFQKTSLDSSGHKNCTKPFLLDVAARVYHLCGDAE